MPTAHSWRNQAPASNGPARAGVLARELGHNWPELEGVLATGSAPWSDDQLLLLDRNGYLEECYFTFSYSPIEDEAGGVGGVFCAVTETTRRVLGERRLRTLRELVGHAAAAQSTTAAAPWCCSSPPTAC
jgi:hypothetical protein